MTRSWRERFDRVREQLREDFPSEDAEWVDNMAHRIVRREWGPEPKKEENPMLAWINRWGVLLSVVYLALGALLKAAGVDPHADPSLGSDVTLIVGGGLAAYGVSRKLTSHVKKRRATRTHVSVAPLR